MPLRNEAARVLDGAVPVNATAFGPDAFAEGGVSQRRVTGRLAILAVVVQPIEDEQETDLIPLVDGHVHVETLAEEERLGVRSRCRLAPFDDAAERVEEVNANQQVATADR